MKTHPAVAAIAKSGRKPARKVLEGYVEVSETSVRIHSAVGGGVVWELPADDVLAEEEFEGGGGRTRLHVAEDAPVVLSVEMRLAVDDGEGTHCGGSGTMYCWRRVVGANGTVVIIMEPCGSCLPNVSSGPQVFERL